jgi:hypothetical protein
MRRGRGSRGREPEVRSWKVDGFAPDEEKLRESGRGKRFKSERVEE